MYHFTTIDDIFQFGKHKGLPLSAVILTDPDYIYWCLDNIRDFRLTVSAIGQIREVFPQFVISNSFIGHIVRNNTDNDRYNDRYKKMEYDDYDDDYDWYDNYDNHCNYGRYAGSYAQDVLGYSDDDIDTIFDGDPSAVWNIE